MQSRRTDLINPSYQQGFATHEMSEAPEQWKKAVLVTSPPLGVTGGTIRNHSNKKDNGTMVGPTWGWERTPFGPMMGYNDGDYTTFSDVEGSDGVPQLTVMAGIIPVVLGSNKWIIAKRKGAGTGPTGRAWDIVIASDKIAVEVRTNVGYALAFSSDVLVVGEFIHIGFRYNGINIQVFFNGVPNGTPVAQTGTIANNLLDVIFGSDSNQTAGQFYEGLIGDSRIFSRGLSDSEFLEHAMDSEKMFRRRSLVPNFITSAGALPIFQPNDIHSQIFGGQVMQ